MIIAFYYSILVGLSNVDGKSADYKYKSNSAGRPKYEFMPKNKDKGIRYVNIVCGAPLGTMVRDIEDYLQKILNKKLGNEEFDKKFMIALILINIILKLLKVALLLELA